MYLRLFVSVLCWRQQQWRCVSYRCCCSGASVTHTPTAAPAAMSALAFHRCVGWLCWLPYLLSPCAFVCVDSEGPHKPPHTKQHHCCHHHHRGSVPLGLHRPIAPHFVHLFMLLASPHCILSSFPSSLLLSFLYYVFLPSDKLSSLFGQLRLLNQSIIDKKKERWMVVMH